MRRVEVMPIDPRRLEPLIGSERIASLLATADVLTGRLDGRRVVNVNSTATGGGVAELTLNTLLQDNLPAGENEILRINDALLALEEVEPRLARVVEMRYFGGYSDAEIAEALDLNKRTIGRDWEKARLLLLAMLKS